MDDPCTDCGSTTTTCWDCKDKAIKELERTEFQLSTELELEIALKEHALEERDALARNLTEFSRENTYLLNCKEKLETSRAAWKRECEAAWDDRDEARNAARKLLDGHDSLRVNCWLNRFPWLKEENI